MKKLTKTVAAFSLMGCAAMNSPIAMSADSGWIIGGNVGQSRAKIDDAQITARLLGSGFGTSSMSEDDRDIGYKIFGGYKYNKYLSVESGYFDLGKFGFTSTTVPAGSLTGTIKIRGLNLDAVGTLPVSERFSVFGRIGAQYAQVKDTFIGSGAVTVTNPSPKKNALNYKAGVGVQYALTDSLGLRGEVERYRINDAVGSRGDIDMASIGLVYVFGGDKHSSTPERAVAPAPVQRVVEAKPEPEPARVIVPVVKKEKYCSILDIQFEINQDEMQLEEKERLGVLGTFMKKYPDTTAVIEGHSDDVGTDEDNLKLSKHRAESVVQYLVDTFKIDRSRLSAVGYGESRPVADNSTAEGKKANRRIGAVIACATDVADLKVLPARVTMALEMEFDPRSAAIDPMYHNELHKVADFMKANPSITANVEGHAGKFLGMGANKVQITPKEAMDVSQRRAQNVVNYLVDHLGIERSRLSAEGFGQTRRVTYGTTLDEQQENRRVNIIFNYKKM